MRTPALSRSINPTFAMLVKAWNAAEHVTILCGAGVSMDAGLPSWSRLLQDIAESRARSGDELAGLILLTEAEPTRSAGLLLRTGRNKGQPDYSLITESLYGRTARSYGTFLATNIAKLAVTAPEKVSIATTNFDNVLEGALRNFGFGVVPLSLKHRDSWWRAIEAPTRPLFHVLHLHGYLGRRKVLRPLILTEDEFNLHGPQVQAEVARILKRSELVLCLGLSMTDSNLLGPLSRRRI